MSLRADCMGTPDSMEIADCDDAYRLAKQLIALGEWTRRMAIRHPGCKIKISADPAPIEELVADR